MIATQLWKRLDAEQRIDEVLDSAKSGQTQYIDDATGIFEVKFVASNAKESAGKFLASGGPVDDE